MITKDILEKLEYPKVVAQIEKYCFTDSGKKITSELLPMYETEAIQLEYKRVNEAKEILIRNEEPPFEYLPDITETLSRSRIQGVILVSKQIIEVYNLAQLSRKLYQFLKLKNDAVETNLNDLLTLLFVDKVFEHHFTKVFDDNGEIKDTASVKLRDIRVDIREKESALQKLVQRLLKQLSDSYLVQEEFVTQRDGRIVLPIKAEHKRHVRGFIHSESATGQTVYIEPEETLEMNNEILSLHFAEKREIEKILRGLTEKIAEQNIALKQSLFAIAQLDSIFARAKYSIAVIGSHPSYFLNKPFEMIDARHPLLLKRLGHQKTVPMNLKLKNEKVVLITGPNAGGKTVTLKTCGLLVCLAQAGIPVPVFPDSNFHIFESVLVDIGDAQSIEDDLSTFSSHLTNIKNIIESADDKSLALLDEIGTGTDPAEGSAIAVGVLISLRDKGAIVLATTHHGSLKLVANQLEEFQNASMEFDTDLLKPTYRFKQGMPGSSYAFEVAQRIGFDDEFINLSKQYLDTDKTKIEEFLVSLEKKSQDLRDQLNKSEIENLRLKGLANLYQNKIEKLEQQKKEILSDTQEKAQMYLKDVNRQIEDTIKNIRESQAKKEVIKQEKEKIEQLKRETKKIIPQKQKVVLEKKEFKVGDYASIVNTSTAGVIQELDNDKNKALLLVGSLKIKTKISELQTAKKTEAELVYKKKYENDYQNLNFRLDLRGMRYEDAEFALIKFLDEANMNGVDRVEVLHGKGTGVLKQLTLGILRTNHSVKNFYFSGIESGGEGITIVEFK
ncbi:MAG: MutS2 family protein [Ignavibacteria bacterium]|nr:MAG: MutS2 family protein [Ignavibacteria bacterium]KAF0162118.1 MAG: MutS2 family protein [Ignavibacteria bacterium]